MDWIIRILGGAIGGNITGKLFKNLSLGTLGNSLAGILGGGLGSQLLAMLGILGAGEGPSGATDIGSILANLGSSGVGGGVLMAIVGLIKKAMGKK